METHQDLVKAARASGLVGLGGAGFPAHIKLNVPEGRKIDTLIINVAECEPYITADHREAPGKQLGRPLRDLSGKGSAEHRQDPDRRGKEQARRD